ncbi:rho-related GTP-binding protein RhoC-like protein, partial [Aphelenchoides avenae]
KVVTVCDTAGEEDFSSLRPLSYPDADVFIVCYSVDQPDSLKHITEKWVPEIKHFCPQTPILVVGNKKDIRDEHRRASIAAGTSDGGSADSLAQPVAQKEAEECARRVSNFQLIECSAKTRENVRAVFDTAIRAAIAYRNRRNNKVIQSLLKLRLVF